jgi:cytochrome b561
MASFDSRVQRFCALSGAASMIIALGGQVAVLPWGQQGWIYHQPSFGASAQTWAAFYSDNRIGIMVGTAGFEIAWVLLLFFSVQFALMTWRLDSGTGSRIITAATTCASMTIPFLMMVVTAFWTVAGYRAHDADPQITRAFSDLGYIGSFIWFYTALVTMTVSGWLMLRYRDRPGAFAPWVGWLSIIAGLTQLPAAGVHFLYTGIFSLNGLIGWYIPLGGWFVWMMIISPVMDRMIKAADGNTHLIPVQDPALATA